LRVVACTFCGSTLQVLGDTGIARYAVQPKITATAARQTVTAWLGKGLQKHSALEREAVLGEAFLCFLPAFLAEADAVGFAFGVEQRQRTVGSGKNRRTETYEVPVERRIERHLSRTALAVNPAEWGLAHVDLRGDELVPFDEDRFARLGMVFPPTRSEVEAREEAFAAFTVEADPAAGLHRTHFRFLELVRPRFATVYYPLWIVRYQFRGGSYQTVIDAESGELAYGKAPGNDLFRAGAMVAAQAAGCFVATTGLQWAFRAEVDNPFALVAVACALGFGIVVWGFRQFRYGGVVEEGSGHKDRHPDLKKELQRALNKRNPGVWG
jgi:hypothetical protein